MKITRYFVALALATTPVVLLTPQPALGTSLAIPAECATKTRIQPRTPGWAFVLNFEVFTGGAPTACLMLYRVVYAPTDFVQVPCKTVGNVAFNAGKGTFNNGYIYCGVNIQQKLAALTPPATMSDTVQYPYFTIVAAATMSDTFQIDPQSNPIGYYQPDLTTAQGLGLYVPFLSNAREIRSEFNGVANISADNRLIANKPYTFTVEHDGGPLTYTSTHYLDNSILGTFGPRAPVSFFTNGGKFWIGVAPSNLSLTLKGTLDEVIFDPPDGARPPTYQSDQELVFVPLTLR